MDDAGQEKKKKKYRNWIKAGLGLKYLRDGLESFCDEVVKRLHEDIIKRIQQNIGLYTIQCGQCDVHSLKPDHVKIKGKCPLFHTKCNCLYPAGKTVCQNNICGAIYDEIIKLHASHPPSPTWRNTDSKLWCVDAWSIAKCFIYISGYKDKRCAAEIDSSGLLNVLINNKGIQAYLTFSTSGPNVLAQALQSRNTILHSAKMELDNEEVEEHIDNMVAALQEYTELKTRQDAVIAIRKLNELKNQDIQFSTETEGDVVKSALAAMEFRMKNMEEKYAEIQSDLEQMKNTQVVQQSHLRYINEKQEFQKKLINLYLETVVKVSLLPLQPEGNNSLISQLYVNPWMTFTKIDASEDCDGRNKSESKEVRVQSARDIFNKDQRHVFKVYIIGEAGSGKSAFCKHIVHSWCFAHSQTNAENTQAQDVEEMKNFDFLFYISLRHNSCQDDIQTMLENQYGEPILDQIMEKEPGSCLILLDGLDEWTKQLWQNVPSQFQSEGIPKKNHLMMYTVVTTSRPWKIESLHLNDSEMHHIVKLRGIDDEAIIELSKRYIDELNKLSGTEKSYESVMSKVIQSPVSVMKNIPVILQQLICLSFDGKLPIKSSCAIYSSMLDLLIEWTTKRFPVDPDLKATINTMSKEKIKLPKAFENKKYIEQYNTIVFYASKLAFKTLFSENKEATISFDRTIFALLNIPEVVIISCLKTGILSEERNINLHTSERRTSAFSFVHKSMQEFLAATFIATNRQIIETTETKQQNQRQHKEKQICEQFVENYFGCIKGLDDLSDLSNVIVFLCGLDPSLTVHLLNYINCIVKHDSHVQLYLATVQKPSDCDILSNVQKVTIQCIREHTANSSNMVPMMLEHVIFDKEMMHANELRYVNPALVASLSICLSQDTTPTTVSTSFEHMKHCQHLKKFYISDQWGKMENKVSDVERLLENNVTSLETISVKLSRYVDKNQLGAAIVNLLPSLTKLRSVKLSGIKLSQNQCRSVSAFITRTTSLQQLALKWIECKDLRCAVDLSQHDKLQYLKTMGETFDITDINVQSLETFTMNRTFENTLIDALGLLKDAPKLKYVSLGGLFIRPNRRRKVAIKLIDLLPSWQNLSTLKLEYLDFHENILKYPSELKNLSTIKLFSVRMGRSTWCSFVNSLLLMPKKVDVKTRSLTVTSPNVPFCPQKYLKEKTGKFVLTFDWGGFMHFKVI